MAALNGIGADAPSRPVGRAPTASALSGPEGESEVATDSPPIPGHSTAAVSDALFDTDHCLNCGARLAGPFCADCGQKKASRIGVRTVRSEAWSRFRWFEWDTIRSAFGVVLRPGTVARQYVLGMRKDHPHPLTLLLLAIGALVLVLGQTEYLAPAFPSEAAQRMYALIREYSNWSFSLGIVAVFLSAVIVFYGRLGYNLTEILALSIYCHALFIGMQILNQSPLLLWPTPELMRWHQRYSPYYMNALQAAALLIAFKQFFLVDLRREGWKLLLAGILFSAIKWGATKLYALAVVELVLWQVGQ